MGKRTSLDVGALTLLLTGVMLTACAPSPAPPSPSPSHAPTTVTSEEQAYRAAEETYRSYVGALNEVDLADPATFEPVYVWLAGDSLAAESKSLSQMHDLGWRRTGETKLTELFISQRDEQFIGLACMDVRSVHLVDADGESQVKPDRRDVYALQVTFVATQTNPPAFRISSSKAVEDSRCLTD